MKIFWIIFAIVCFVVIASLLYANLNKTGQVSNTDTKSVPQTTQPTQTLLPKPTTQTTPTPTKTTQPTNTQTPAPKTWIPPDTKTLTAPILPFPKPTFPEPTTTTCNPNIFGGFDCKKY